MNFIDTSWSVIITTDQFGTTVTTTKASDMSLMPSSNHILDALERAKNILTSPSPSLAGGKEEEGNFTVHEGETDYAYAIALLGKLLYLKDLKDKDGKTEEYLQRQPEVWNRVRKFLDGETDYSAQRSIKWPTEEEIKNWLEDIEMPKDADSTYDYCIELINEVKRKNGRK